MTILRFYAGPISTNSRRSASTALPAGMLLVYLILFATFKARGGNRPVELASEGAAKKADPGF